MSASRLDRYAVIGHPVAHSRSPFIHTAFAAATGQQLIYDRIDAAPERFEVTVREFFAKGGKGLNVTVPHKEAAAVLAGTLTHRAQIAGAVNTLWQSADGKLVGDNTDGVGLINDLTRNLDVALSGSRILIIGAGGAARGILGPLLEQHPSRMVITNRTPERASGLAALFPATDRLTALPLEALEGHCFDLVLNATSASLSGALPPLPRTLIGPTTIAYDLAYAKGETVFTRFAMDHGARAAYMGLGMLVEQAAEAFSIWRGVRPKTADVLKALVAAS